MLPDANPIGSFPNLMRSSWLPMSDPLQSGRAYRQARIILHSTFLIIWKLLSRVTKVLDIHCRRECVRRSSDLWVFSTGELDTYQSAIKCQEL